MRISKDIEGISEVFHPQQTGNRKKCKEIARNDIIHMRKYADKTLLTIILMGTRTPQSAHDLHSNMASEKPLKPHSRVY